MIKSTLPKLFALFLALTIPLAACGDAPPANNPERADAGMQGDADASGADAVEGDAAQADVSRPDYQCSGDGSATIGDACRRDDECGCGTHCAYGACAADCAVDTDCDDGQYCDEFGRCRDNGDDTLVQQVSTDPEVSIGWTPRLVVFPNTHVSKRLHIFADNRSVDTVKVYASASTEVSCDGGGSFWRVCTVDGQGQGGGTDLVVRLRSDQWSHPDQQEQLRLATRNREYLVGVSFDPASQAGPEPPSGPGIYEGQAVLHDAGFSSRDPRGVSGALATLTVPVEVRVSEDGADFKVLLSDKAGVVFPAGDKATQATLTADGDLWTLDSPNYLSVGKASPQAGDVQIVADVHAEHVAWRGDALSFIARTRYHGVTLEQSDPLLQWRVQVVRKSDLDGASVPVGTQMDLSTPTDQRAQLPVPAETSFRAHVPAMGNYDAANSFVAAGAAACTPRQDAQGTELTDTLLPVVDANGDPIAARTADLACAGQKPMKALPELEASVLDASQTFQTCYGELDPTKAWTSSAHCIDTERLRAALAYGLRDARLRALGDFRHQPGQGMRLATYLMGQWMAGHTFVAHEFRDADHMQAVTGVGDPVVDPADPTGVLTDLLQRMDASWDVLLHPRYGVAWGLAPQNALRQPDYRAEVVDTTPPDGPQQAAAPVMIARAVRAQARITDRLTSRARVHPTGFAQFRKLAMESVRKQLIAYAIARGLFDDASVLRAPSWLDQWTSSRDSMARALVSAIGNVSAGVAERNPLGIQKTDLPLYGIDDQSSAAQRFLAVSHFLLGSDARGGVAREFIDRASQKLDDASSAYEDYRSLQFRKQLAQDARDRRIDALKKDYGGQIASLCNPAWTAKDVLGFSDQKLDPNTCYLRDTTSSGQTCRFDENALRQRLTAGGVLTQMCIAQAMRNRFGQAVSSGDKNFDSLIDSLPLDNVQGASLVQDHGAVSLTSPAFASSTIPGAKISASKVANLVASGSKSSNGDFLTQVTRQCQAQFGNGFGRPAQPPGHCDFTSECPLGYVCSSGQCAPRQHSALDNPECYRGQLGAMALQLRSTATDVDIANSELKEHIEQYRNDMRSCLIAQLGHQAAQDELERHNQTMRDLDKGQTAAEVVADVAAGAKDCASAFNAAEEIGGGTAFECAAAGVEAGANSAADTIDYFMDEAQRHHESFLADIEHQISNATCFNDAQADLIGARSDTLQIKRARQELARQLVEFQSMKDTAAGLVSEGRDSVERERNRRVSPLALNYRVDNRIQTYDQYFRIAKRSLYLAMLAVEYELQMTYAGREDILAARTQADLNGAQADLTNFILPNRIPSASPPDNGVAVLSLKNDLLEIADHSNFPEGAHQLSAEQRLDIVLSDPQNAVYGDDGQFKGVEIPFTVAPGGQQGQSSVPILSGRTCAERLWTVNASILGDDLIRGSDTHISQLELRKRNTFFSQWCNPDSHQDRYQFASVRPSRNLFLDPRAQSQSNAPSVADFGGEPRQFSKAAINAYINVARGDLEDESYSNGDSLALAGRGLFGDYTLFIPADALSLSDDQSGLVLNHVDDILIRFDYVAALKN